MTPVAAMRSVLTQSARFTGRASRSEFWWFALFEFVVASLAGIIDGAVHSPVPIVIVGVALLLPSLTVSVRRLHDTDRSGWWVLVEACIPLIGLIWLLILCAQTGSSGYNKYGPLPT